MDVTDLVAQARDAMTVKRALGESFERDGLTVVPVAKVWGGAGGGEGETPEAQGQGSGGGFGLHVRPVGVFVIRGDEVTWQPVLDVTRVILGAQIAAIVAFLAIRSIMRARAKG